MATTMPIAEEEQATAADDIKPYRLQWSNRRLDLTRQKLELTRLPHENSDPPAEDWWEPKPQIEFLIDYWLEKYSWRAQEKALNNIPQFRTSIPLHAQNSSENETSLRLHFIHAPSPHPNAVPLVLIPPFPLTNLSLTHLIPVLTNPDVPEQNQPFHLVIPSLPGLGFSDALPNNITTIAASAGMLDTLMTTRLGYARYLATGAGAGTASPAGIDWRIVARLAESHAEGCVGAHLISPALRPPVVGKDPWEWAKWRLAMVFGVSGLGYTEEDIAALRRPQAHTASTSTSAAQPSNPKPASTLSKKKQKDVEAGIPMDALELREPNTLAYALCDSPTGLLAFVLKTLHLVAGPGSGAAPGGLTPDQILTMTNLAWLPGPEAVMRFWAYCSARRSEHDDREEPGKNTHKPKVAITVFLGGQDTKAQEPAAETAPAAAEPATAEQPQPPVAAATVETDTMPRIPLPKSTPPAPIHYICPAWANIRFDVLHTQRVSGQPGLLAFERPELIVDGIRALAKSILTSDSGAFNAPPDQSPAGTEATTSPLERVVVVGDETAPQVTVAKPEAAHTKPATETGGEAGAASASAGPATGEGAPMANLAAPAAAARSNSSTLQVPSPFSEGGNESTPDTLVVSTPPLSVKPSP